jgi:hypothetical protein
MSVQPRPWPEVVEQTAAVARAAFPKGTLAMRVRDELPGLFADEEFVSAFGGRGKPGISPGQLALVTVLQFAENLTDRQAADAVRGRIDWKYTLGLELTDPGFDHTVLTGHCCFGEEYASITVDCDSSDGERELGERSREPMPRVNVGGQFVVAAANILDKGVAEADHPYGTDLFETAHRP